MNDKKSENIVNTILENREWIIKHHENHDVLITVIQNLQKELENDYKLIENNSKLILNLKKNYKNLRNTFIAIVVIQFALFLTLMIILKL